MRNSNSLLVRVFALLSLAWAAGASQGNTALALPQDNAALAVTCPTSPPQRVVFSSRPSDSTAASSIYISVANGTSQKMIPVPDMGLPYNDYPKWSWDRRQIVFTKRLNEGDRNSEDIFIMCNDGSNLRRLTNNNTADSWPSFTADGSKILAVHDFGVLGVLTQTDIVYMDINTGAVIENLTQGMVHPGGLASIETDPRLSLDGTKVVFGSDASALLPLYSIQIYIMNTTTPHNITRLTYNDYFDTDPALSPDNQTLVFSSYRDPLFYPPFPLFEVIPHDWYIFKAQVGATPYTETQLTTNPTYVDIVPVWRPDTNRIAFLSARNLNPYGTDLFDMSPDGSNPLMRIKSYWRNENYQDWR